MARIASMSPSIADSGPARPYVASRSGRHGEMVRPSCYLNAVEIGDGNSLLYNGFSLCMDVVPSEIARRLVSCGKGEDFSFLLPAEREYLVERGHLTTLSVAAERKELRKLAHAVAEKDIASNGQSFRGKSITFVLTYRCNLSCAYCYQSDVRKTASLASMSEAFVDDFFRNHLEKLYPGTPRSRFGFLLYGGEPLLPENRRAVERILHYAKKQGNGVSTVTNAVLLPKMLDLIGPEKGKINHVQVTLDGGRMFHDEQRVSSSGGPTFEQTIHALRDLMKTGANAIVRIHLHPDRMDSARALVEYLREEKILGHAGVKAYFWSTDDLNAKTLSPQDYEYFHKLFLDVSLLQNSPPTAHFAFLNRIMALQSADSRPVRRHCDMCVAGLHCVVDAQGDIYECIDDAGRRDRRAATLAGGKLEYFQPAQEYGKPHLRDKPDCLECSIALFCGGGCPNRLKVQNESVPESFCLQVREFVALSLKSYFLLNRNTASTA